MLQNFLTALFFSEFSSLSIAELLTSIGFLLGLVPLKYELANISRLRYPPNLLKLDAARTNIHLNRKVTGRIKLVLDVDTSVITRTRQAPVRDLVNTHNIIN